MNDQGSQIEVEIAAASLLEPATFTLYYGLADDRSAAELAVETVGAQGFSTAEAAGESEDEGQIATLAAGGTNLAESTAPPLCRQPNLDGCLQYCT